jgi:probable F420-dependent oxidoreductase
MNPTRRNTVLVDGWATCHDCFQAGYKLAEHGGPSVAVSSLSPAVNLPFRGLALHDHRQVVDRIAEAGAESIWVDEINGVDGVAALATFAAWRPDMAFMTAITNVFTRGPALLAMSAAAVAGIAPGRATFGIGASSDVVVERWNGLPHERPYTRVAETLAFLRDVLREGSCARTFETFQVDGFRLAEVPDQPPRLAIGGLGERMQRLAATDADILVTGMLAPGDVSRIKDQVAGVARRVPGALEIHGGVFVIPPGDEQVVDFSARRHLTSYLPIPAYASFQGWLGRGDALGEMHDRWTAGDRRAAMSAIPSDVVHDLVVSGSLGDCISGVRAYLDAGLDGVNIMIPATVDMATSDRVEFLCALVAGLVD